MGQIYLFRLILSRLFRKFLNKIAALGSHSIYIYGEVEYRRTGYMTNWTQVSGADLTHAIGKQTAGSIQEPSAPKVSRAAPVNSDKTRLFYGKNS